MHKLLILFTPSTACTRRLLKSADHEYVVILIDYKQFWIDLDLFWEQGVGGSNPLAPTKKINDLKMLEYYMVALTAVFLPLLDP